MELKLFNSLWGFDGDYVAAVKRAAVDGYDGVEGQAPAEPAEREAFAAALEHHDLLYIQEITTAGGHVPERHANIDDHLQSLKAHFERGRDLNPIFVTSIAGCDAWPEPVSVRFFWEGMELAEKYKTSLCYETHRSRSLYNPWITRRIVEILPTIKLTLDVSHWCVVCERQMDSELDVIEAIAPNVSHIQARIGYAQGPQVPHPGDPVHAEALASHQRCWEYVWNAQQRDRWTFATMTPEFGPDGYLHTLPFTQSPVADLRELNTWMMETERAHFARYSRRPLP